MSTITRLYNLLHTGNPGDIDYYRAHCHRGMHVLELGCGSGRVSAALCAHGCIVEGLDSDPEMLRAYRDTMACFTTDPVCHLADMRAFDLNQKFDRVIIPFNGLLCMLSLDDVAAVFTCARRHLRNGGELIFDVYHVPDDFENDGIEDDAYIDTAIIHDEGTAIEVYEKTLSTDDPQRFDTSYIFVVNAGSPGEQQIEHTIMQRCLYLHQIKVLLRKTGFETVIMQGDFLENIDHSGISEDTRQIAVRAVPESI